MILTEDWLCFDPCWPYWYYHAVVARGGSFDDSMGARANPLSLRLWVSLSLCVFAYGLSMCLSTYQSTNLFVYPSVFLSICLSICLSNCLSVYVSICLSGHLPIYVFVYLFAYFSVSLSAYLSVYLFVSLSMCLSVYLSVYLSIYLT